MKKKLVTVSIVTGLVLSLGTTGIASAHGRGGFSGMGMGKGMFGSSSAPTLDSILKGLVDNKTLTQAQVDAINKALTDAKNAVVATAAAAQAAHEKLIADAIGIDIATIKSRLAAGESLGAIAGAKKDALISVLVAEATKQIDAAVAAGRISAATATTLKTNLTARITAEVNEVRSKGLGLANPNSTMSHIMGSMMAGPRR